MITGGWFTGSGWTCTVQDCTAAPLPLSARRTTGWFPTSAARGVHSTRPSAASTVMPAGAVVSEKLTAATLSTAGA